MYKGKLFWCLKSGMNEHSDTSACDLLMVHFSQCSLALLVLFM